MLKKSLVALLCLICMSALYAWAYSTYYVRTKTVNAGGTVTVRNGIPLSGYGSIRYTNFTTMGAVSVVVAPDATHKIMAVTRNGAPVSIPDPTLPMVVDFYKNGPSSTETQSLEATFATRSLSGASAKTWQLQTENGNVGGNITTTRGAEAPVVLATAGKVVMKNYTDTTPVTVKVTPVAGYSIKTVTLNGVKVTLDADSSFTVDPASASGKIFLVIATYSRNLMSIQAASVTGGTITPSPVNVAYGGMAGMTVTPTGTNNLVTKVTVTGANPTTSVVMQDGRGNQTAPFRGPVKIIISNDTSSLITVSAEFGRDSTNEVLSSCALTCHLTASQTVQQVPSLWLASLHRQNQIDCVVCHTTMPGPIVRESVSATTFKVTAAKAGTVGDYYCVRCHAPAIGSDFEASPHKANGFVCTTCHKQGVHNPGLSPTLCADCHATTGIVVNHPFPMGSSPCLACHNPHSTAASVAGATSAHFYNSTTAQASYVTAKATCMDCHVDVPGNATVRGQWAGSGHAATADAPFNAYDFKTKDGCVKCHTTTGFVAFSSGKVTKAWGQAGDPTKEVITCKACHSDVGNGVVRVRKPVAPFDVDPSLNHDMATSNLCVSCHSGRNNGASIQAKAGTADFTSLPFIAPHYLAAGATVQGNGGYHFPGGSYSFYSSNSHRLAGMDDLKGTGTSGPCVACHMTSPEKHSYQAATLDANGNVSGIAAGVCASCHGNNLTVVGLAADQSALNNALNVLKAMLQYKGFTYSPNYPYFSATSWGSGQAGANAMGAAFNYKYLAADPGAFAHNQAYAKRLAIDSIDVLYNGQLTGSIDSALNALVDQGLIQRADANAVTAFQNKSACTSCHSNTTGSHTAHLNTTMRTITCADCHSATAASATALVAGGGLHLNGRTDLVLANGGTYYAPNCSGVYCHSNGKGSYQSPVWNTANTSGCDFCHPLASLSGSHAAHIGIAAPTVYGSTANNSTASEYRFGCGLCHPTDVASHLDGRVTVSLIPSSDGSLKSKNSPSVVVSGVGNTGSGIAGTPGVSVTCSAAYCHSNGGAGGSLFYTVSPDWYHPELYTGDRCAMCHGNSPATGAHQAHVVGVHYKQIFDGTGALLPAAGQPGTAAGHGDPNQSTTINCDLCHSASVTNNANDNHPACTSCHTGVGSPAKGTPILDKGMHLNGTVDIALKAVTLVSKAQVRPSAFSSYSAIWTRNNGSYKTGVTSYDVGKLPLNAGIFNSGDKSCSNIACHNGGTPKWNGGALSCVDCHSAL